MDKKTYDRIWRRNNPDKVREARNRWKKKNPDKVKEERKKWKRRHPEHIKEYKRKYRELHRDPIKEAARQHRLLNPRKSNNHRPWKYYPMEELIKRDGKKCNECGSEKELSVNHKIPRVVYHDERKIWDVDIKDLNILCRKCNGKHYQETVKKSLKHYFSCKLIN